jgi:multiple sugar transport system permease protein
MKNVKKISRYFIHIIILLWIFTSLVPIFWALSTALKTQEHVMDYPPQIIPKPLTLENFRSVLVDIPIPRYFRNSLIVALSTVVVSLAISSFTAYGFARLNFPGKEIIFFLMMLSMMLPGLTNLVVLYIGASKLKLIDTYWILIIIYAGYNIPFSTWLLRGFIEGLPTELDDAGLVDGCTRVGVYFRVILPLMVPGLAAAGVMAFITSWNEFIVATTFANTDAMRTLQVGLRFFMGAYYIDWGRLMAGAIVATIPALLFFIILQRGLIAGLTRGAIK